MDVTQRVGVYSLSNKMGSRQFDDAGGGGEAYGEHGRRSYYEPGRIYDHEEELAGRTRLVHRDAWPA